MKAIRGYYKANDGAKYLAFKCEDGWTVIGLHYGWQINVHHCMNDNIPIEYIGQKGWWVPTSLGIEYPLEVEFRIEN